MLNFFVANWSQILLITVGASAVVIYLLQERRKKIDAASLVILQIDQLCERLQEISTFIIGGQLNATAFYESLPLMEENYWSQFEHFFVREIDSTSYSAISKLYNYASEVQEQQLLVKSLQKSHFELTQKTIIEIEAQYIKETLDKSIAGGSAQETDEALTHLLPPNVSEKDSNTLQGLFHQITANYRADDTKAFWDTYYQKNNRLITVINQSAFTPYTPAQVSVSLEKILKEYSLLSVVGTDGYRRLKKISKRYC